MHSVVLQEIVVYRVENFNYPYETRFQIACCLVTLLLLCNILAKVLSRKLFRYICLTLPTFSQSAANWK